MTMSIRMLAGIALACATTGCWPYGNEGAQYFHRSDTITLGAGNAKDVNAAIHVIDPMPRRAYNQKIPANGDRMVGAVQRYQGRQGQRGQGAVGGAAGAPDASVAPPPPPVGAATPTLR